MPVAKSDLPIAPAAGHTRGAALLLASIDPIRKLIVGDYVIELRGRLVIPGAICPSSIDCDDGALIAREKNNVRVVRVDPYRVIVVAARCASHRGKAVTCIGGSISRRVARIHDIPILRMGLHFGKVASTTPDPDF